jgi:hypothetical protein
LILNAWSGRKRARAFLKRQTFAVFGPGYSFLFMKQEQTLTQWWVLSELILMFSQRSEGKARFESSGCIAYFIGLGDSSLFL